MNVSVREEVESHVDLILEEVGEIIDLAHRRGRIVEEVRPFWGVLDEFGTNHDRCWRHAHLGLSEGGEFFPHQI